MQAYQNCEDIPIIPPTTPQGAGTSKDIPIIPPTTSQGEGASKKQKRGISQFFAGSAMEFMINTIMSLIDVEITKLRGSITEANKQKIDYRLKLNEELKKIKSLTKSTRQKNCIEIG